MKRLLLAGLLIYGVSRPEGAAGDAPAGGSPKSATAVALKPARVFDGVTTKLHEGWVVVVRGSKIDTAGPADQVAIPAGARVIALPDATLLPGLIDAHTHVLLHPY